MLSKFVVRWPAVSSGVPLGLLLGCLAFDASRSLQALGQDQSGVKIALTLTPSAPEAVKKSTEAEANQDAQPLESKAKEKALQTQETPAALKLSPFQLSTDAPAKAKAVPSGLEQAPSPPQKLQRPGKAASAEKLAPTKPSSSEKLEEASGKPMPVKPLGSREPNDRSDNEDAEKGGAECPGGVDGVMPLPILPDDIPLEQEDHPYDAPAAESSSNKPDRPTGPAPLQLNSEQLRLRTEINQLLRYYMQNPETIAKRSPWAVMHAVLPFGVEAELSAGNRRVNAIGWMSYNGLCKTQRIFQPTKTGFRTNIGPGVQGHEGQFLAILAQSKVAPTYPIKVGARSYTVADLVRLEMTTCREKSELTFKLLGLSYYLEPNQRWRDNQGGNWTLEKLVAEELAQPVVGAACGGTHRLMGLTFSLLQRKQAGLPIDGHWSRSEQFLNEFVAYALSLQNPDGSFSTEWFEARANDPEVERKVQTTGHVLEWLIYTLPDEQLQSPPIQKAIRFLLDTIGEEPGRDWPIGPRGHSLRALALYNQRVFGAQPGKLKQYIANLNTDSKQR